MDLRRSCFLVFCFSAVAAVLLIGPAAATELYDAVRAGNVGRVVQLLNSGANPNKTSPYDGPMHEAARLGSPQILARLIQAGADIELAGFGGNHPLHTAALAGKAEIVSLLLRQGAKVDSIDNTGRTPLLAVMSADIDDPGTLIELLEAGADPNSLDGPAPFHPLDYAAMHGRADIADILIAFGADVNAKDNLFGKTPLHYAIADCSGESDGRPEVAQLLIDRGADVNAKDAKGLTPLDYAKMYLPNAGYLRFLLIKAGAR
jgi:ankyrin repeat protein